MSRIREDLPDFSFVDINPDALLSENIAAFEDAYYSATGEVLQLRQGDPLRVLIYSATYQHYLAAKIAEHMAKQNLLAFAEGDILDYRAANYGKYEIYRLPAQKAVTTMLFTLSAPLAFDSHIPVGTKVTAGDNVFFVTADKHIGSKAYRSASLPNSSPSPTYTHYTQRPTNINLLPCIRYTASFTTAELSKLKNFLATLPE